MIDPSYSLMAQTLASVLTGLLAGRSTCQIDYQTDLVDTVDALASQSEWGRNAIMGPVIQPADLLNSIASRSPSFRFTRLYPTNELNVVPSVDQDAYRPEFQTASTQTISLHAVAKNVGTK